MPEEPDVKGSKKVCHPRVNPETGVLPKGAGGMPASEVEKIMARDYLM